MAEEPSSGGPAAREPRTSLVDVAEDALRRWLAHRAPPRRRAPAARAGAVGAPGDLARHAAHGAAAPGGERRDRAPPGQRHLRRARRVVDARRGPGEARLLPRARPPARPEAGARPPGDRAARARRRAGQALRARSADHARRRSRASWSWTASRARTCATSCIRASPCRPPSKLRRALERGQMVLDVLLKQRRARGLQPLAHHGAGADQARPDRPGAGGDRRPRPRSRSSTSPAPRRGPRSSTPWTPSCRTASTCTSCAGSRIVPPVPAIERRSRE